ncbi:MAG: hypothetical protein J0G29_03080 [Alphaproteobacteria bacterium]|nr:hypothetical protein [Alphaproteobacteria bacterium]
MVGGDRDAEGVVEAAEATAALAVAALTGIQEDADTDTDKKSLAIKAPLETW